MALRILNPDAQPETPASDPPIPVCTLSVPMRVLLGLVLLVSGANLSVQWCLTLPALRAMEDQLRESRERVVRDNGEQAKHRRKVQALQTQQLIQEALKVGKVEQ